MNAHLDAWNQAQRILCVRLDAMGDVLMTTPALRALRNSGSARRITLLTSTAGAAVAALIPEIDDVIVYDAPWLKASATRDDPAPDFALIAQLRARRFDAAAIFTVFSQNPLPTALVCYLAGIPLRLAHCRENPYQLLSDWVSDPEPERGIRHEVQRQLDLVAYVGARTDATRLSLHVPAAAAAAVDARLAALAPGQHMARPLIVIHPGASAASRRYPAVGYAAAVRALPHDYRVVFTGGAHENALIETIRASCGRATHTLAGVLDLAQLAAIIQRATVLLCNNTGPAHMAAALGTPVVDLYALTNPQHTPWQVANRVLSHDVACKYCYKSICPRGHHDCLAKIAPQRVAAAVQELVQARPAATTAARTAMTAEDSALCTL